MASHSYKEETKPHLFSYDIDTEIKNIELWVYDNRNYSKRDLQNEKSILIELAETYIEIIETRNLLNIQLHIFIDAIKKGPSSVWETASSKLEKLAYYFDNARLEIIDQIKNGDSKTAIRLLNCLSTAFPPKQQLEILNAAFTNKSEKVRKKAAW